MSGFQSPNYTQTPNDFFDMLPDMSDAELRVTLVMIRQTFGFHRDGFKMGINKLAAASGLSRNGAKDGAEVAEKRGTFRRVNPTDQTEAEWELVVTPSTSDHPPGQSVTTPPSTSDPQVGVKERVNKEINLSIENAIYAGLPVTEAMAERASLQNNAPRQFENALGFSKPLAWWSNKEWTAFAEWVCERYAEDKLCFANYNIWRNTPYTKGGMSNNRIRGFVKEFYDSWDMFKMATKTSETTRPEYQRYVAPVPEGELIANPKAKR